MSYAPQIDIRTFRQRSLIEFAVLFHIMADQLQIVHPAPRELEILLIVFRAELLFAYLLQVRAQNEFYRHPFISLSAKQR